MKNIVLEQKGDYTLIVRAKEIDEHRNHMIKYEYVVAWLFDSSDGTWGQGHYFYDLKAAIFCFTIKTK